jgi:prepilin-type N-terminal cleavage/methylation domain-containing protein
MDSFRKTERGFTLIELVVVLAILGILIALAVPRYLGARRNSFLPEGDNTLNELKTMGWGYYQQYGTWTGLTAANFVQTLGFQAPGNACWSYTLAAAGAATNIQFQAQGNPAGAPAKCAILGAAGAATITLQLNSDGSATRAQSLP